MKIGDLVVKINGMHAGKLGLVVEIWQRPDGVGLVQVLCGGRMHKWYTPRVKPVR